MLRYYTYYTSLEVIGPVAEKNTTWKLLEEVVT